MSSLSRSPNERPCVVILCDCDPDRVQYGGPSYDTREPLKWRGVEEGIPKLVEAFEEIEHETGRRINVTWCVRADLQMKEIYGDAAWPYLEFRELWEALEARGDEIAWHPHLWRWSEEHHCWYQEIRDNEWIERCLTEGFEALSRAKGHAPTVCRMGWEFHNNTSMRTIDRLGIRVDMSAAPGHYCEGTADRGSIFHKYTDWRGTPEEPYRPSVEDYRRPARDGERELSVWEVPLWTHVGWVWRAIGRAYVAAKNVVRGRLRAALAGRNETMFHIPALTMPPAIFMSGMALSSKGQSASMPIVVAFHCDELLSCGGIRGRVYNASNAIANLGRIRLSSAETCVRRKAFQR